MEPWLVALANGDFESAWKEFHGRYHRLILATIRRLVHDPGDRGDVCASVCAALVADRCARLRRYSPAASGPSAAGTWVVAVVRNLTVDWLRKEHGRPRFTVPPALSPLQQAIYSAICLDGHSPAVAYELLGTRRPDVGSFREFLRAVRETHLAAPCPRSVPLRRPAPAPEPEPLPSPEGPVESAEAALRLRAALATLPPDLRLAVELYVVEQLPAAEVARLVGWPNAKAVYNRVSRALAQLRARLGQAGIGRGDL
jgi:RNA polymerase sigma factor (sigma-70 family)